jgi:hypothetical protein
MCVFCCRQRCRTTIEDFACTYFPLHGLDVTQVRRLTHLKHFLQAYMHNTDNT